MRSHPNPGVRRNDALRTRLNAPMPIGHLLLSRLTSARRADTEKSMKNARIVTSSQKFRDALTSGMQVR